MTLMDFSKWVESLDMLTKRLHGSNFVKRLYQKSLEYESFS